MFKLQDVGVNGVVLDLIAGLIEIANGKERILGYLESNEIMTKVQSVEEHEAKIIFDKAELVG